MSTPKSSNSPIFINSNLTTYLGRYTLQVSTRQSNFEPGKTYNRFEIKYDGSPEIKQMIVQGNKVLLSAEAYIDIRHLYSSTPTVISGWGYIKQF